MTWAGIGCLIMAVWLITVVTVMAFGDDVENEIDEWENDK